MRVDPNTTIGTNPVAMTVLSVREFEALVRTSVRLPSRIFFLFFVIFAHALYCRCDKTIPEQLGSFLM